MSRERHGPRRRPISLTPLIDIIFLLLLFFMLSSTFTRFAELPLLTAGSGAARPDGSPVFVQLGPETLRVNGAETGLDGLPDRLSPLMAGERQAVLLSLAPGVTSQRLVDTLDRLRGVPGAVVSVLD